MSNLIENTNPLHSEIFLGPAATFELSTAAASNSGAPAHPQVTHKVAQTMPSIKLLLDNMLSYAFPKELTSVIYDYSRPSQQEITELFLKLFFADQYVDESLAKECQDVAQFWLKEITHLDLSKVNIDAIGRTTISKEMIRGFFENVLQKYFPSLKTIDLPKVVARRVNYRDSRSSFKIPELLSFNGPGIMIKSVKEGYSDNPFDYCCEAQFNKIKDVTEERLTAQTAQTVRIFDKDDKTFFSARLKDPSKPKYEIQETLRTALPRHVSSIIHSYTEFTEKEISELFLKVLFSDQFVDESLTRECDDVARFWLKNITHLDLSRVQIHVSGGSASKTIHERLSETIHELFPNLSTMNPPIIFINHGVVNITRLNCRHLTIISEKIHRFYIDYFCHARFDSHEVEIIDPSKSSDQTIFEASLKK